MFKVERTKLFSEDMKILSTISQKKVEKRIDDLLVYNPTRNETLESELFKGIRKMRMGVKEFSSGVRVLYTICKECHDYSYNVCEKFREQCTFSGGDVIKLLRMKPRTNDTYEPSSLFR